jgi:L-Ala-D/L-Glu epimerase
MSGKKLNHLSSKPVTILIMLIKKASVYLVKWQFTLPVQHSLATNIATENIILKIVDEHGNTGYGEGVPRSYVTGETVANSIEALKKEILPLIINRRFDPANALSLINNLFHDEKIDKNPSAICAVETAILDIAGKILKKPVSDFLSNYFSDDLIYSAIIPVTETDKLQMIISLVRDLKITNVKVKVGHEGDNEMVAMVRNELGYEIDLRIDVNGAWSPDESIKKIQSLEKYRISSVEQPVEKNDIKGLAKVTSSVKPKVIADESLCTPSDAISLINTKAVSGFNLRLSKCGGLSRASRLFKMAKEAGVLCQLGCQVGELGILSAAGRHFASSHPNLIHLEGSLTRFFLPKDIIKEDLRPVLKGSAPPLTGPGLGVTVIDSLLQDSHLFTIS